MGKRKQVTLNLEQQLVDKIDNIADNRSEWFNRKMKKLFLNLEIQQERMDKLKQEKEDLLDEKHNIEKRINNIEDEIEELNREMSKAETIKEIKSNIGMKKIERIRKTVKVNKQDPDPRASTPRKIIDHNVNKFSEELEYSKDEIRETLEFLITV